MASDILERPACHNEQVGTSIDQLVSHDFADGLCAGLLAERHLGYTKKAYQSPAAMVGSLRGRNRSLAGPMVPFCSGTPHGERLRSSPIILPASQWYAPGTKMVQSSVENEVDSFRSNKRKRQEVVEPDSRRIRRFSKRTLGGVDLGKETPLSDARVLLGGSERQQRGRVATSSGVFGGHSSLESNSGRQRNGNGSIPNNGGPVQTLARHEQPGAATTYSPEPLASGGESGTPKEHDILHVHVLRLVGEVEDTKASWAGKQQPNPRREIRAVRGIHLKSRNDDNNQHSAPFINATRKIHPPLDAGSKGMENQQTTHSAGKEGPSTRSRKAGGVRKTKKETSPPRTSELAGKKEELSSGNAATKMNLFERLGSMWDEFFFARTTDLGTVATLRTAYAFVVVINLFLLLLDLDWFLRVMPTPLARDTMDQDTLSVLVLFKDTIFWPKACAYLWIAHAILLGLGIAPRWQAFGVFFCHVQLAHHNNLLWNGEDFVMRLLAFFMIFFPNSHSVFDPLLNRNKMVQQRRRVESWPMWPFRLVQIQMCLIYFSTGGLKWGGKPWAEGFALYQVVQNDAIYGCWFNPDWMFGYTVPLKLLTHVTTWFELGILPFLWFGTTRKKALLLVTIFHLSLDLSMNLNVFHWVMIIGWCSFLIQPTLPPAFI